MWKKLSLCLFLPKHLSHLILLLYIIHSLYFQDIKYNNVNTTVLAVLLRTTCE